MYQKHNVLKWDNGFKLQNKKNKKKTNKKQNKSWLDLKKSKLICVDYEQWLNVTSMFFSSLVKTMKFKMAIRGLVARHYVTINADFFDYDWNNLEGD